MQYKEVRKDLFTVPKRYVLVHCIAADAKMGAGIAKEFRRRYPGMPDYVRMKKPKVGDVVPYRDPADNTLILNMVTKQSSYGKPTIHTMDETLMNLAVYVHQHNITHLAMPAIGSGLDRLNWSDVNYYIQKHFHRIDVKIAVCFHAPSQNRFKVSGQ